MDNLSAQANISTNTVPKGELVHKKACKNCFKLHRKCNKQMPCDYCSLRGKPCEINPCIKKRGRPLGSTNKAKTKEEKEAKKAKKLGRPKKAKSDKKESAVNKKEVDEKRHSRPFMEDFSFDNSIVINELNSLKYCAVCSSAVVDSAKFCTNCGIPMEDNNPEMHIKLDSLRWKNTILEQKLHRISTTSEEKKSISVAPALASWDYSNIENLPVYPGLTGSFLQPIAQDPQTIKMETAEVTSSSKQNSNLFDITEPAIFLDSSHVGSDQMINWAFSFDQSFQKRDSLTFPNDSFSNFLASSEFPIFREQNFPPKN